MERLRSRRAAEAPGRDLALVSPRSQNSPVMICRPSRKIPGRACSLAACWPLPRWAWETQMVGRPSRSVKQSLGSEPPRLGSTERIGSMFGKTLLYYFATSVLAITTGIIMVNLIRPGVGAELPAADVGDRKSVV